MQLTSMVLSVFCKNNTLEFSNYFVLIDSYDLLASFVYNHLSWWIFNVFCESGRSQRPG